MNKILGAVSALALMLAVNAASADEATGKIQSINEQTRAMTLDSGQAFTLAEGVEIDGLTPGTEVKVSFEPSDGGAHTATAVEKAAE